MTGQGGSDARREAAVSPLSQANMLGVFSVVYTFGYSAAALAFDESLPSLKYWGVLIAAYTFFWLPFYFAKLRALPELVARGVSRLIDELTKTSMVEMPATTPRRTSLLGSVTTRTAGARWPVDQALLVQLHAASTVLLTAWYTTYTGGPFVSPFGQVLLALPLLSPNVANNWESVLVVYLTSAVSAIFAGVIALDVGPSQDGLYWGTTLGVLALSGFVAVATRRRFDLARKSLGASNQ